MKDVSYAPFLFLLNKSDVGKWDQSLQLYCKECFPSKREEILKDEDMIKKKPTRLFCRLKQRRHNVVKEKGKFTGKLFKEFINEAFTVLGILQLFCAFRLSKYMYLG
jgi:hypothetical protein